MNYKNTVRDYIITDFMFGDAEGFHDDVSFIESGIVDSTGILELVMFLEATYRIRVAPEEMIPENLDSVNKIVQFLARKLDRSEKDVPSSATVLRFSEGAGEMLA